MALRAKWQFMDRSVTFGPYNILWVTSWSINCHMALSAMNYLINIVIHYGCILYSKSGSFLYFRARYGPCLQFIWYVHWRYLSLFAVF